MFYEPFDAVFTVGMKFEMLMPLLFVCTKVDAFNPNRFKSIGFKKCSLNCFKYLVRYTLRTFEYNLISVIQFNCYE